MRCRISHFSETASCFFIIFSIGGSSSLPRILQQFLAVLYLRASLQTNSRSIFSDTWQKYVISQKKRKLPWLCKLYVIRYEYCFPLKNIKYIINMIEFSTSLFGVFQFVKNFSKKTTVVLVCSEICINNNVNVMSTCCNILTRKVQILRVIIPICVIILVRIMLWSSRTT